MKKRRFFSALLLAAAAAAFAQTREDIRIFIPPVIANAEQARFFHENFTLEISTAGYTVTDNENDAHYSIQLTVRPNTIIYPDGTEESAPPDAHQNILLISLVRNSDKIEIVSLFHRFTDLEEMYHYNLYLHHIYQAINVLITETEDEEEETEADGPAQAGRAGRTPGVFTWDTTPLYFGGSVFLSPRIYQSNELSSYFTGIGIGILAEFHFLWILSVGTGAELATDGIAASPRFGDEYWNAVLQVPLKLQFVLRPGSFMFQFYFGIAFNFPILPYTIPPLLSWQAGIQNGIRAGPGVIFADLRFAMDFGKSGLDQTRPHDTREYDRYMFYLGVGYKWGVGSEK